MARIDSITIGKGKGSLGNVTLRETKDGTIASQKISKGTQKIGTYNQTVRRVMLSNIVNAYQGLMRLSDAGMKVAFTNKPQNESDFNAFVRYNMNKKDVSKVKLTKTEAGANVIVPAPFILSDGDLLPPTDLINTYDALGTFELGHSVADMGDVADVLINYYGCRQGDILTFVCMSNVQSRTPFVAKQIAVNPLSTDPLPLWITEDGDVKVVTTSFQYQGTIIRGRVDADGYKVSRAAFDDFTEIDVKNTEGYILHTSHEYEVLAVQSYGYKLQPYLQSAENAAGGSQPDPPTPEVPILTLVLNPEDGGTYTINGEHKPVGEYEYPRGSELEVSFEAAAGWTFGGWKNREETDPDFTMIIDDNTTLEAIILED